MFEKIVLREGNKFYKVKNNVIDEVQDELGIIIPKDLSIFYSEIGYGFLNSDRYNFNRIMDPESVRDFRLRKGQFGHNSELEIYDIYEKDTLIFFEICEGNYLAIGFSKSNLGKIFCGRQMIADSLTEFLTKYQNNEGYFI